MYFAFAFTNTNMLNTGLGPVSFPILKFSASSIISNGERTQDFCVENALRIANTHFVHREIHSLERIRISVKKSLVK